MATVGLRGQKTCTGDGESDDFDGVDGMPSLFDDEEVEIDNMRIFGSLFRKGFSAKETSFLVPCRRDAWTIACSPVHSCPSLFVPNIS
jgi:hypothetical protein